MARLWLDVNSISERYVPNSHACNPRLRLTFDDGIFALLCFI